MIYGVGIDSVEIERFAHWHTYHVERLHRIFSTEEIAYCLQVPIKSAERFAARFAAREALFKALSGWQPEHTIPLLTLCKAVTMHHNHRGAPHIVINWQLILPYLPENPKTYPSPLATHTHTRTTATAYVVLTK